MKRHGNLFSQVVTIDNLSIAFHNAAKGKHWQRQIKACEESKDELVEELRQSLIAHTFHTSPYRTKWIYEPKKRLIFILPFYPDRIVQHAIMQVLEPIWDKLMIHNSFACRRGKGQHKASDVCKEYAMKYEYCVQCDIRKFYPSIRHDLIKSLLRRKIKDKEMLWLLDDIIDSAEGERNVPIGNYLSQWLGNLFMNELDTFVKQELHVNAYLRYCDDFLIFGDDKTELKNIADKVEAFCNEVLDLTLSKKSLFHTYQGVDFVGYRHFKNGKVLVRKRTARRIMRKLKRLPEKVNERRIAKDKARSIVASAEGWLKHANTYNLREAIELWRLKGMVIGA
ncbi:MAG: group II intron reverse transcriptase domain-containing protein [Selenomonadaceae bacterium]|nr:group II intron reverse transcriptase domain-containing protein [Selenomonadaceae bacterium]